MQFDRYGPIDVLHVAEVPRSPAGEGQVLVEVAAGINPGEIAIRNGAMEAMFPATFPSGQGSDFAGRVVETGPGVIGFAPGDEVMGWSGRRSAQADHVLSDPGHLIAKPPALDWIRAGAVSAIGVTSFSAVRAVAIRAGDVVAVSGATGGVGGLAAQLARRAGAQVLGIASAGHADLLRAIGVEPVAHGDGLGDRRQPAGQRSGHPRHDGRARRMGPPDDAECLTLLNIGSLLTLHVFLGMLLLGPAGLKTGSTLWRFTRYYTGSAAYVRKGPPAPLQRVTGPFVILTTVAVLGTGIMLAVEGPGNGSWGRLHHLSFFLWAAVIVIHLASYVPKLTCRDRQRRSGLSGWRAAASR